MKKKFQKKGILEKKHLCLRRKLVGISEAEAKCTVEKKIREKLLVMLVKNSIS